MKEKNDQLDVQRGPRTIHHLENEGVRETMASLISCTSLEAELEVEPGGPHSETVFHTFQ